MQFWSGTAFLNTADALAVTRMLDETGYDGMICADHLIYPRELRSPYPTGADTPPWEPETAWPDSWVMIGAMAAHAMVDGLMRGAMVHLRATVMDVPTAMVDVTLALVDAALA